MLCERTASFAALDEAAPTVDLWVVDGECDAIATSASPNDLTQSENNRLSQFTSPHARRTFATARSVLRRVLGKYLGTAPRQVPVAIAAGGKPYLDTANSLYFNLAHSWPLVAVAVSDCGDVGVDVEVRNRKLDIDLLSNFVLTRSEQVDLLSTMDRAGGFLTYWTIKEAVAKASSLGLRIEPRSIELDRSPLRGGTRTLTARVEKLGRWHVSSRETGTAGIVAVASQFRHKIAIVRSLDERGDVPQRPLPAGLQRETR